MAVSLEIPSYLQSFAEDMETVEVSGKAIGQCIDRLLERFPRMRNMLFSESGELLDYVGIFINGEDAHPNELAAPTKDGDQVQIIYIIGGG